MGSRAPHGFERRPPVRDVELEPDLHEPDVPASRAPRLCADAGSGTSSAAMIRSRPCVGRNSSTVRS